MKNAHYLFYKDRFKNNYNEFYENFNKYNANAIISYSYKTNMAIPIIKYAKKLGIYAEVVSEYEYRNAKKIGYKDCNIIYNGIVKNYKLAYKIAKNGGIVNVDNETEFVELKKIANQKKKSIKVGLRITFNGVNEIKSRFGVNYDTDNKTFNKIISMQDEYINIVGLHSHFCCSRTLDKWILRAEKMCEIALQLKSIQYLDFGGGMFSTYYEDMKSMFTNYCNREEYCKTLATIIDNKLNKNVKVIIESGTSLIADTCELLCYVKNIKKCNNKNYVTVDISDYDLGMLVKNGRVFIESVNQNTSLKTEKYNILGYTCREFDLIKENYKGCLKVGDCLIIRNVGAYAYSLSNDFINPKLKMEVVK